MTQQINFVDPSLLPPNQQLTGVFVAILGVAAVVGVALHYAYERMELAKLMAQSAALEGAPAVADDAATAAQEEAQLAARSQDLARKEALRDALAAWSDLPGGSTAKLAGVIAALPDTLWLKDVEFTGKDGLRITGGAIDPAALASYSTRLGRVDGLHGVPMQLVAVEPPSASGASGETATQDGLAFVGESSPRDPAASHYRFVLSSTEAAAGTTP